MIPRILTSRWIQFAILLCLLLLLSIASFSDSNLRNSFKHLSFDSFNQLHPRESMGRTVIIDVDERTLDRYGQWPLPRNLFADMVTNLKTLGAQATLFDVVFPEEDRSSPHKIAETLNLPTSNLQNYDQGFAQAIRAAGNVVLGFTVAKPEETRQPPYAPSQIRIRKSDKDFLLNHIFSVHGAATNLRTLTKEAAGNGIFLATPDDDGLIREIPALIQFQDSGQLFPTLTLDGLRVAHNPKESLKIGRVGPDDFIVNTSFGNLQAAGYAIHIGESGIQVPIQPDGKFLIKYRDIKPEEYISAYKIIDPAYHDEIRDQIAGKIAFVGTSAEGLKDIRSTPLNVFIPGVEVHVNMAEQILQGDYLTRPAMIAPMIEGGYILGAGLILLLLSLFSRAIILSLFTALCIGFAVYAANRAYVDYGLLFDPAYPSLAIGILFVLTTLLNYIRSENRARDYKNSFGMYLSPDVMKELIANPDKLRLGGENRTLSVMFTDIRNFTTISERLTPEELIQTMNDFLTPMSDVVMRSRGTIDKYMGDAMMAFWNAPLDDNDHARHAVQAALDMEAALQPVNEALMAKAAEKGEEPLRLAAGIGINTGPCSVGNMGSKQRFAYSALGDAVNLASRLESQTKSYGLSLLIGEETAQAVPDYAVVEIDLIQVKGKTEPARIFTVVGDADTAQSATFKDFILAHEQFLNHYRAQEFDAALLVAKDQALLPEYYAVMMQRIEAYKKQTPPKDWNGVFVAMSK